MGISYCDLVEVSFYLCGNQNNLKMLKSLGIQNIHIFRTIFYTCLREVFGIWLPASVPASQKARRAFYGKKTLVTHVPRWMQSFLTVRLAAFKRLTLSSCWKFL